MVRSTTKQVALLSMFAIASMQSSYVHAENVDVTAQKPVEYDNVQDSEYAVEETLEVDDPIVDEKRAENPVHAVEEPVVVEEKAEEPVEEPIVVEEKAEEPVEEPIVVKEKAEDSRATKKKIEEPILDDNETGITEPVVIKEVVDESIVSEKDAATEDEQEEEVEDLIMDIDDVEMKEEIISKIKDILKSSDLDAKKIAAFGLGAWGTATGIGWAMEKIGGKKDN